nr:aspartate kinase [Bacilli bacterium]
MLIVQKYGGTSVGSPERIGKVADRIAKTIAKGHQVVVVVSAMGHSTDALVDLAAQVTENPDKREMDALLATGEQVSTALVSMALQKRGIQAKSFTGWQAAVQTEPVHGAARIETIDPQPLSDYLKENGVAVVAGFQGIAKGAVTTLGRGGSDTTAVAIAAALKADLCEIYTDVDGVYTADPRKVTGAYKLEQVSYDEMLELANLGSQVLHPRAVETAKRHQVALVVRSSFTDAEGTVVKDMTTMEGLRVVTGVAQEKEVARLAIVGVPPSSKPLTNMFRTLAKQNVNVDVIVQSILREEEVDVSFTVSEADLDRALELLEALKESLGYREIVHEKGLCKVSIVGAGMISNPGVAAQMFEALEAAGARVKMVSTSEIKVSCVIESSYLEAAINSVHASFLLDQE